MDMKATTLPVITMNRLQVGALERFFGGYRDRLVSVAQEPGDDRTNFCTDTTPLSGHVCAVLTLEDVESLIVAADAKGGPIIIYGGYLESYE